MADADDDLALAQSRLANHETTPKRVSNCAAYQAVEHVKEGILLTLHRQLVKRVAMQADATTACRVAIERDRHLEHFG